MPQKKKQSFSSLNLSLESSTRTYLGCRLDRGERAEIVKESARAERREGLKDDAVRATERANLARGQQRMAFVLDHRRFAQPLLFCRCRVCVE